MDPVSIQCDAACTVTLVLSSPWEALTSQDGALIAATILAVWAVGFGFRALIRVLRESDEVQRDDT